MMDAQGLGEMTKIHIKGYKGQEDVNGRDRLCPERNTPHKRKLLPHVFCSLIQKYLYNEMGQYL